jgi:hypothetical protein
MDHSMTALTDLCLDPFAHEALVAAARPGAPPPLAEPPIPGWMPCSFIFDPGPDPSPDPDPPGAS